MNRKILSPNGLKHLIRPHFSKEPAQLRKLSLSVKYRQAETIDKVDRERLRNIGIVAHINAGKTTTTERILFLSGTTDVEGDVDKGNTVTDYLIQERNRGITITSAAVSFDWDNHRINLVDTPGHVDFTIEVERSLSVLDGAVTILDASAGVEAQTITVWNQASRYRLPNIIFLNKHDKPQADYKMCMKDLKFSLNVSALLTQIPVQNGSKLSSIIDVISRKHFVWKNPELDKGRKFTATSLEQTPNLDQKYVHAVEEAREHLVNHLSDIDDNFASHVLGCDKICDVDEAIIVRSLRKATLDCKVSPVLLGSSFKHIGVQPLLDAIVAYLPAPQERAIQISKEFSLSPKEARDNCAFIFKIMHDKRLGPLTYLRVNNGSIHKLQKLFNVDTAESETVKRVYRPFADELREIEGAVYKDDIVVVTGVNEARTGDILGDSSLVERSASLDDELNAIEAPRVASGAKSDPKLPFKVLQDKIVVPQISSMEPVFFCSIEASSSSQQLGLEKALACLAREDPSFSFNVDNLGITTIRGMGKLHLEIVRDRIRSEHGIGSHLGPLQVSYRETIEGSATEELSINRMVNGVKNSLTIQLYVRAKPGAGLWTNKLLRLDLSSESSLGRLRHAHRRAIENGVASALSHGPLMGYPVIDADVLLLDFKANGRCGLPIISSAASQCLANAMARCSPLLLEPIMLLEVVVPKEHNGIILGDLTSTRRALVVSTTARSNGSIVTRAKAPLASMADYSEFLRISTSGRASFSMELHSYSAMSSADSRNVSRA